MPDRHRCQRPGGGGGGGGRPGPEQKHAFGNSEMSPSPRFTLNSFTIFTHTSATPTLHSIHLNPS